MNAEWSDAEDSCAASPLLAADLHCIIVDPRPYSIAPLTDHHSRTSDNPKQQALHEAAAIGVHAP